MVGGAPQRFQFFRQKTGFLEIIEVCLNLGITAWVVVLNYKKIST